MSAAVTIDFAGGVATASPVRILVSHAQVALAADQGVVAAVQGFTGLSILNDGAAFPTAIGGTFHGTLTLLLDWSGQPPAVALDNLVPAAHGGPATISWPSEAGPETQILTPGIPLTLSGIVAAS